MSGEGIIGLYSTGFTVSMVIAILGAICSVGLFFLYDIKTVFLVRTGRAQKLSEKRIAERNEATSKLKADYSFEYDSTSNLRSGRRGRRTSKTTSQTGTTARQNQPVPNIAPAPAVEETTLLQVIKQENPASAGSIPVTDGTTTYPFTPRQGFKVIENILVIHTHEIVD